MLRTRGAPILIRRTIFGRKDISVQSDLLTLTYKDDSKLDYYGSNVKEKEKIIYGYGSVSQ